MRRCSSRGLPTISRGRRGPQRKSAGVKASRRARLVRARRELARGRRLRAVAEEARVALRRDARPRPPRRRLAHLRRPPRVHDADRRPLRVRRGMLAGGRSLRDRRPQRRRARARRHGARPRAHRVGLKSTTVAGDPGATSGRVRSPGGGALIRARAASEPRSGRALRSGSAPQASRSGRALVRSPRPARSTPREGARAPSSPAPLATRRPRRSARSRRTRTSRRRSAPSRTRSERSTSHAPSSSRAAGDHRSRRVLMACPRSLLARAVRRPRRRSMRSSASAMRRFTVASDTSHAAAVSGRLRCSTRWSTHGMRRSAGTRESAS